MNESATELLVVCAGARVSALCSEAISNFLANREHSNLQFAMSEWLGQDQFRRAALLWLVDDSEPWDVVHRALHNGIPLLVSDHDILMKELCLSASCGIFYRDAVEAEFYLEFLLANNAIRQSLGASAQTYVTRRCS